MATLGSQLSIDPTPATDAAGTCEAHWNAKFPGQLGVDGAVLSITVIVCTQDDVDPSEAVHNHVLAMVLAAGQEPAVVTSLYVVTAVQLGSTEQVAVPVFDGSVDALHWIVTFAGQVTEGAHAGIRQIAFADRDRS